MDKKTAIIAVFGLVITTSLLLTLTNGFILEASGPRPDLEVSHASLAEDGPVQAGTDPVFDFKVTNVGDANAPEHSISCYLNGTLFDSGDNGNALAPREEDWSWCQAHDIGPAGDYTFKICVDEENAVDEGNEGNNCDDFDFVVVGEDTSGSCPLDPKAGRTIVEFPQDGLRSDWDISFAQEDPVSTNLDPGKYKVTFVSFDDHSSKTVPQDQPNERWYLKLYNGNNKFKNTDSISDLPENKDFLTEVVHQNLNIKKKVTKMIPFHAVFPDTTSPNSVDPVCAAFDKIDIPPPPPPAPSCTFSADPSVILKGEPSTLTWTTKNAASASINKGIGTVSLNGSESVSPTKTTTYTLTVDGEDGSTITCKTKVTVQVIPPPTSPSCTFSASPTVISPGGSSTLTWTTQNTNSVSIDKGIGNVSLNGSTDVSPSLTTTYTLTAVGDTSEVTCETTVVVSITPPPAPSCTLSADPSVVLKGELSTLTWTTKNASSASLDQGIGGVSLNGSKDIFPTETTTYTLTVKGEDGSTITCKTKVTVQIIPPPTSPSCTLSADPTTIESGESSTLTWTTKNALSVSLIGPDFAEADLSLDGSKVVFPPDSGSNLYTLTVTGSTSTVTCEATVIVDSTPPPALSCTLSASPSVITPGGSSTLTWTTEDATSAEIDNGVGSVSLNGSTSVSPSTTTTYTLLASAGSSEVTCQATVTVSSSPLADVSIEKSVSNSSLAKGSLFTYTLNYQNTGNLDAEDVTIDDTPSPTSVLTDFTIISGPDHGSCSAKTHGIECDLGTLGDGESGTVTYKATGSSAGNVTNTAIIDTSTPESDLTNNEDSETVTVFVPETPGCQVNCGGGLDPPTVLLFKKPIEDFPFASQSFIYLSQVPYTGITGGFKSTMILLLLAIVSIYISYFLIEKRAFQKFTAFLLGGGGTITLDNNISISEEDFDSEYELYASSIAPPVEKTEDLTTFSFSKEEKDELIEKGKTMGALLSDSALILIDIAASVKGKKKEAVLEELILSAKSLYPKEDDYLILDSRRVEKVLFSINTGLVQTFVNWLSLGESKEAFEFLRLLRNNKISIEDFIKRVTYYLDNFYRCHIGETVDESHKGIDFEAITYCWNKDELQEVIATLVNAVDESYKSQEASIKLALIKIVEITKQSLSRRSYYSK